MATRKTPKAPAHVQALRPDPQNARRRTARNLDVIVGALQELGPARSIVIDESDTIIAGHGTVEAAKRAGVTKLQVVEADGETLIAVRRRNLTPDQKRRLALVRQSIRRTLGMGPGRARGAAPRRRAHE